MVRLGIAAFVLAATAAGFIAFRNAQRDKGAANERAKQEESDAETAQGVRDRVAAIDDDGLSIDDDDIQFRD